MQAFRGSDNPLPGMRKKRAKNPIWAVMQREKEPWHGGGERGWGRTGIEWVTWGSPVFSQGMVCPAGLPSDPRTHGVSAVWDTDRETSEVLARRNMNSTEHKLRAGSC